MERQWEDFPFGPSVQNTERVHVTLSRKGGFFLNRRAHEAMGEPDFVTFKFDRRHSTIGICPTTGSHPNAFNLYRKKKTERGPRIVYASNFLRYYQISTDETLAFPAAEVDKTGVLILSLHEVKSVGKIKPPK